MGITCYIKFILFLILGFFRMNFVHSLNEVQKAVPQFDLIKVIRSEHFQKRLAFILPCVFFNLEQRRVVKL
jgi:hypothetical protein